MGGLFGQPEFPGDVPARTLGGHQFDLGGVDLLDVKVEITEFPPLEADREPSQQPHHSRIGRKLMGNIPIIRGFLDEA